MTIPSTLASARYDRVRTGALRLSLVPLEVA